MELLETKPDFLNALLAIPVIYDPAKLIDLVESLNLAHKQSQGVLCSSTYDFNFKRSGNINILYT